MPPDWLITIAGGAALALGILGGRMLAPFYGHGPFLAATVLGVGALSIALGAAWGGRRAAARETEPRLGFSLMVAGGWTVLGPWICHPVLAALERFGLEIALIVGAAILLGPPLVLLGSAIPRAVRLHAGAELDPGRAVGGALARLALGGVGLALVCSLWLLPSLGVIRTAAVIGALEAVAGALALRVRGAGSVSAALLVTVGVLLAWSFGRVRSEPRAGLVAVKSGTLGELRVIDKDGGRYLLRDGTIHAVIDPDHDVSLDRGVAALELLKRLRPEPGDLLVLGMRGGSVAKSFEGDGWSVRVVEPDSLAAHLAFDHFGLQPSEVRLTIAEPRPFARRDPGRYRLILLDTFADNVIPPELVTREFFESLAHRLEPGGILAVRIESRGWDDPVIGALAATLRSRFPAVLAMPTAEPPNALGGMLVLASDEALEIPEGGLPEPIDYIADPFGHWTVVQMNHAWGNRFEPSAHVAVLTDDRSPADLWGVRINRAARRELHRFFGPHGRSW